ncbi:MAG: DUF1554 domain-containing protein [Candidatus Micrarchaeota archaeon]
MDRNVVVLVGSACVLLIFVALFFSIGPLSESVTSEFNSKVFTNVFGKPFNSSFPVSSNNSVNVCREGWKCKSLGSEAFQNGNCSWSNETKCVLLCLGGRCVTIGGGVSTNNGGSSASDFYSALANGSLGNGSSNLLNNTLKNNTLPNNTHVIPNVNLCAGVSCQDKCDGTKRKYNGQCLSATGQCVYSEVACANGCESSGCKGVNPCAGVTCGNVCDGNTLKSGGTCVAGTCQYSTQACPFSCLSGSCKADPCSGITCPNVCDGTTRKYGGSCSNGVCQYASGESCNYGCENGTCKANPCAGLNCFDKCEGDVRKYGGSCSIGVCQYASSQTCPYGCSGGVCKPQYFCNYSWPQEILESLTNNTKWLCAGNRQYCKSNTLCCKYNERTQTHYECVDCEAPGGNCVEPGCIGVTCNNYCSNGLMHTNGRCVAGGTCVYDSNTICLSGICNNAASCDDSSYWMFITSQLFTGNLGGISGADTKCQQAAAASGRNIIEYKALLSTSTMNAKDRLPDGVFKNSKGEVIATSKADLLDGTITNLIQWDEYGNQVSASYVWSGSYSSGMYWTPNCGDWTSVSGSGKVGYSNEPAIWLGLSQQLCGYPQGRLYCFRFH